MDELRGRPTLLSWFGTHLLVGMGVALASTSCGNSSGPSDASSQIASADSRLRGTWTLVEFHPTVPLEPMLASLLSVQLGYLTAQFDGARINVRGIGVGAVRTYKITDATMNDFAATLSDEEGVAYDARGHFDFKTVKFESLTSPWAGQGTLARLDR